ncbi:hypothetical protein M8C21_012548, partial [Ambrosia artemisiifolia]
MHSKSHPYLLHSHSSLSAPFTTILICSIHLLGFQSKKLNGAGCRQIRRRISGRRQRAWDRVLLLIMYPDSVDDLLGTFGGRGP